MNTVIEQLAEQAAEAVVAYDHDVMLRVEHEEGATLEVPADFIFKFAQLLVQECINNVESWEKDSRNHISYMLKNHFGVDQDGS